MPELLLPDDSKVPYAVFDDVILENILPLAWDELDYIDRFVTMSPVEGGTAYDSSGKALKSNNSLWMHTFYNNRKYSPIVNSLDNLFCDSVIDTLFEFNSVYTYLPSICVFNPLLSRYVDGDYYEPHTDKAFYTLCLHMWREPKEFEGGEFYFELPNGDIEEVETKPNRAILFPSCYRHSVTPVKYNSENSRPRYSVNVFLRQES